jgi:hypothetical protein
VPDVEGLLMIDVDGNEQPDQVTVGGTSPSGNEHSPHPAPRGHRHDAGMREESVDGSDPIRGGGVRYPTVSVLIESVG